VKFDLDAADINLHLDADNLHFERAMPVLIHTFGRPLQVESLFLYLLTSCPMTFMICLVSVTSSAKYGGPFSKLSRSQTPSSARGITGATGTRRHKQRQRRQPSAASWAIAGICCQFGADGATVGTNVNATR